jgi:hypothetical protein
LYQLKITTTTKALPEGAYKICFQAFDFRRREVSLSDVNQGCSVLSDIPFIQEWHNEIETTDCILADYDTRKLFVCWGTSKDDRHLQTLDQSWTDWEVHQQTEGLIFHFDYIHRDRSLVEMTDEAFDAYCQTYKQLEFNLSNPRGWVSDEG